MKLDHPTPAQRIEAAKDRARHADDEADDAIYAARLNRDDDTEHRFHLNRARWLRRMAQSYRLQADVFTTVNHSCKDFPRWYNGLQNMAKNTMGALCSRW